MQVRSAYGGAVKASAEKVARALGQKHSIQRLLQHHGLSPEPAMMSSQVRAAPHPQEQGHLGLWACLPGWPAGGAHACSDSSDSSHLGEQQKGDSLPLQATAGAHRLLLDHAHLGHDRRCGRLIRHTALWCAVHAQLSLFSAAVSGLRPGQLTMDQSGAHRLSLLTAPVPV